MRLMLLMAFMFPLAAAAASLPKDEPVPGGVVVIQLPDSGGTQPVVTRKDRRIMVVEHAGHWYAIAGIPLATPPGQHMLLFRDADSTARQIRFNVSPKVYPEQQLIIKNPQLVNPTPAQLRRIKREQSHLQGVLDSWVQQPAPQLGFLWPAAGPETSGFGLRRVLNGQPRSPHSGIDIGAPAGTAVRAPADAVVADLGDYYFCGKTLTLDLGQGLYSVYCHLSKITVKRGERVQQGQVVGAIGTTGRTTGPNLHWTVSLNGTPVDPHAFLISGPAVRAPAAAQKVSGRG
ncbi:MAG: peptidoglycan DD-metalloendopeptidase family protein [Gammaproteobacteria bacterium]|nr:peptidoglycan DD-metalloendopeptidase family protein [Gammaproteobacteria bacterium]